MEKIIVTGGLGFIGSNLINILKDKYFIINIDKVSYASNFKNIDPNIKNYKFYRQDINNKIFIKNILKKYKPSTIYNLAAETHVDRSIDAPKIFIENNILGVFNLLESIRVYKKKIKLIHISTDEVYGDIKKNQKSKEKDPYNPSSPYSASKASGDLLISFRFMGKVKMKENGFMLRITVMLLLKLQKKDLWVKIIISAAELF